MNDVLAIVAPGQGAQKPGFVRPWLKLADFRERFETLSDVVGRDLPALGSTGDQDAITDTAVAQPLLVVTAICAAREVDGSPADAALTCADVLAGHSVGEIATAALSGALRDRDAASFVRVRGLAMARAAAAQPTGMSAVLGGDRIEVLAAIEAAGLTPANHNGPGQIVAAGTAAQLAAFAASPPRRTRIVPLGVAGAFHTAHMSPAAARLTDFAATLTPSDPVVPLLSDADGAIVGDGADLLARLVAQVSRPVRWDLCQRRMIDLGVTGLLELPPAGTLTGLARRGLPGVATFALNTPDQLDDARAFVSAYRA
jgi:[acyl-carrier-protein] S-malonyltransferase